MVWDMTSAEIPLHTAANGCCECLNWCIDMVSFILFENGEQVFHQSRCAERFISPHERRRWPHLLVVQMDILLGHRMGLGHSSSRADQISNNGVTGFAPAACLLMWVQVVCAHGFMLAGSAPACGYEPGCDLMHEGLHVTVFPSVSYYYYY